MSSRATMQMISLCIVVLVWSIGQHARAQTDPAVAEAKNHYKKAESAIQRGDWQTASQELQQSATLAPANALIHLDLAMAYAHTGNAKLASAELQKATQLGLPAEQLQTAEALRKQLASQSPNARSSPSNKRASSSGAPIVSNACVMLTSVAKASHDDFGIWKGAERHSSNSDSSHHYYPSSFALPGGDCSIASEENGGWFSCEWKADTPAIVKSQFNSLASDIKGCSLLRGTITELPAPELELWLEDLHDFKGLRIDLSGERGDDPNVSVTFYKH